MNFAIGSLGAKPSQGKVLNTRDSDSAFDWLGLGDMMPAKCLQKSPQNTLYTRHFASI